MQANLNNPQELFQHNLSEMLYVERKLADQVLPQISQEVRDGKMREGVEMHRQQTQQHVRNIEQAFQALGTEPKPETNYALDGLKQDHDQLAPNIQMEPLRDLFDAQALAKTESYEVASYHGLIMMAQQMGRSDVQQLLETNCRQDEEALTRAEQMAQQIGQQMGQAA